MMFLNTNLHTPLSAVTFYRVKLPSKLKFWAVSVTLELSIFIYNFKKKKLEKIIEDNKTGRA